MIKLWHKFWCWLAHHEEPIHWQASGRLTCQTCGLEVGNVRDL